MSPVGLARLPGRVSTVPVENFSPMAGLLGLGKCSLIISNSTCLIYVHLQNLRIFILPPILFS